MKTLDPKADSTPTDTDGTETKKNRFTTDSQDTLSEQESDELGNLDGDAGHDGDSDTDMTPNQNQDTDTDVGATTDTNDNQFDATDTDTDRASEWEW